MKLSFGVFLFFIIFTLFTTPLAAQTQEVEDEIASTNLHNDAKVTQSGSVYISEDSEVINNDVENDVVFAGGDLVINGDIVDNVIFAGNSIEINGNVNGDIIFAGGILILNGNVDGDVRAIGGNIFINSEQITGDLLVLGVQVSLLESLEIFGDVDIKGWQVQNSAVSNPFSINEVVPTSLDTILNSSSGLFNFLAIVGPIISILGLIISAYFAIRIFPTFSEKTLVTMKSKPFVSLGVGILSFFIAFFVAILLLFSFVGIHLLTLLLNLGILSFILGSIYSRYVIGRLILQKLGWDNTGRLLVVIVGVLLIDFVLGIFTFLPFIADLINLFIFGLSLWGVGAIVLNKYNSLNLSKK